MTLTSREELYVVLEGSAVLRLRKFNFFSFLQLDRPRARRHFEFAWDIPLVMAACIMLLALLVSSIGHAFALPTIQAKGSKLFTSDGNQFFIKGQSTAPSTGLGISDYLMKGC